MVEASLQDDAGYMSVWFNPWQFTKNDDIVGAFFEVLSSHLINANNGENAYSGSETYKEFVSKIIAATKSVKFRPGVDLSIPFVGNVKLGVSDKDKKKSDLTPEQIIEKFQEESETSYYDLVRYLRKASETFPSQIIVFVDDLDRCDPEKAVELLEGLKVLLDLPNFTFVLGVANKVIESAVNKRLLDIGGEELAAEYSNYLDKIIQFSFVLPPADPRKLVSNIIHCYYDAK